VDNQYFFVGTDGGIVYMLSQADIQKKPEEIKR
jgi:hypothetical protein